MARRRALLRWPLLSAAALRGAASAVPESGGGSWYNTGAGPDDAEPPRRLRIFNGCGAETIWIANEASSGTAPDPTNLKIEPMQFHDFITLDGLASTRFWPKVRCDEHGSQCELGSSGGPGQGCVGPGDDYSRCAPPVDTKFEATFGNRRLLCDPEQGQMGGCDYVDASLVDGYTLPFKLEIHGQCVHQGALIDSPVIDCSRMSVSQCPSEERLGELGGLVVDLRSKNPHTGNAVGCYSPCLKLVDGKWNNTPAGQRRASDRGVAAYCCPTPPESPEDCRNGPLPKTAYVNAVHAMCPGVYGYTYDDGLGLMRCGASSHYQLTFFCPSPMLPPPAPEPAAASPPPVAREDAAAGRSMRDAPGQVAAPAARAPSPAPASSFAQALVAAIGGPAPGPSPGVPDDAEGPAPPRTAPASTIARRPERVVAAPSPPVRHFNCTGALARGAVWPDEQKAWCCKNTGFGCQGRDAYDCTIRSANWQAEWSAGRSAWCCLYKHVACPQAMEKPAYNCTWSTWQDAWWWPVAKKKWCCRLEARGCAPLPTVTNSDMPGYRQQYAQLPYWQRRLGLGAEGGSCNALIGLVLVGLLAALVARRSWRGTAHHSVGRTAQAQCGGTREEDGDEEEDEEASAAPAAWPAVACRWAPRLLRGPPTRVPRWQSRDAGYLPLATHALLFDTMPPETPDDDSI